MESAFTVVKTYAFFGRLEHADRRELFPPATPRANEIFDVSKLSLGYLYDFPTERHVKFGIGALLSKYSLPNDLESSYGSNATSYMIFARVKIR